MHPRNPVEFKDFKDLKSKNVAPVVQASTPGPGIVMDHTAAAWVSGTIYAKKALVSLEGHTYRSKIDGNNQTPSSTSAAWTKVK